MSSTNRSKARDAHIADYYITPIEDIELFLKAFNEHIPLDWSKMNILDPCAGGNCSNEKDAFHEMSYPNAIKNLFGENVYIDTYDIRKDSLAYNKCDYLTADLKYVPDIIITNPPFNKACEIIEKAINDVSDDGYVIMLLRLNFFGSKGREDFFKKYKPEWIFIHHLRMSFCDKKDKEGFTVYDEKGMPKRGSTDSIEYMHAVFHKSKSCPETMKTVLI